jgi:hypothetical protein
VASFMVAPDEVPRVNCIGIVSRLSDARSHMAIASIWSTTGGEASLLSPPPLRKSAASGFHLRSDAIRALNRRC